MSDEFVNKEEFNIFKEETNKKINEINNDIKNFSSVLNKIDKKTDLMLNNIENNKDTQNLKIEAALSPIIRKQEVLSKDIENNKEDIEDLKSKNQWLSRTIGGALIGLILEIIIAAISFFK